MKIDLNSSIRQALSHKTEFERSLLFGRQKAIGLLLIIALSLGTTLNAEPSRGKEKSYMDLPVTHDLRPKFVLFSWTRRDGSRRFALISNRDGTQEDRFIDKFSIKYTKGIDIGALEHELIKLPTRCLVTWIRDEPHKLDYAEGPSSV